MCVSAHGHGVIFHYQDVPIESGSLPLDLAYEIPKEEIKIVKGVKHVRSGSVGIKGSATLAPQLNA